MLRKRARGALQCRRAVTGPRCRPLPQPTSRYPLVGRPERAGVFRLAASVGWTSLSFVCQGSATVEDSRCSPVLCRASLPPVTLPPVTGTHLLRGCSESLEERGRDAPAVGDIVTIRAKPTAGS